MVVGPLLCISIPEEANETLQHNFVEQNCRRPAHCKTAESALCECASKPTTNKNDYQDRNDIWSTKDRYLHANSLQKRAGYSCVFFKLCCLVFEPCTRKVPLRGPAVRTVPRVQCNGTRDVRRFVVTKDSIHGAIPNSTVGLKSRCP